MLVKMAEFLIRLNVANIVTYVHSFKFLVRENAENSNYYNSVSFGRSRCALSGRSVDEVCYNYFLQGI